MRIHNADGSEADACGNATRCVAELVRRETGDPRVQIETIAGLLEAETLPDGRISVDMGLARTGWRAVPLDTADGHRECRSDARPAFHTGLHQYRQPHPTFFVDDAEAIDLATLGPALEHHPLFPQRANIGVAAIRGPSNIRLECGSEGPGSHAPAVAARVPLSSRRIGGVSLGGRRPWYSMAEFSISHGARTGTC